MTAPLPDIAGAVAEGWVTAQRHPTLPLTIYNYSKRTTYERHWTPVTRMCRGLIVEDGGRVVARPFPKFFNLSEQDPAWSPPPGPITVTEKLDGSLGVHYPTPDGPAIATRGSFVSRQAVHATAILRGRYAGLPWDPEVTYLFEIIYPANRIVVDYGPLDDLVLLAALDTATGRDLPPPAWFPNHAAPIEGRALEELLTDDLPDEEGYVVRFADGTRVKIKFAEYVRLHRLLTGLTARRIWEMLANGESTIDLPARIPEEFVAWLQTTVTRLTDRHAEIVARVDGLVSSLHGSSRKEAALALADEPLRSLVFAAMDGKEIAPMAWKLVRPAAEQPFRTDVDG